MLENMTTEKTTHACWYIPASLNFLTCGDELLAIFVYCKKSLGSKRRTDRRLFCPDLGGSWLDLKNGGKPTFFAPFFFAALFELYYLGCSKQWQTRSKLIFILLDLVLLSAPQLIWFRSSTTMEISCESFVSLEAQLFIFVFDGSSFQILFQQFFLMLVAQLFARFEEVYGEMGCIKQSFWLLYCCNLGGTKFWQKWVVRMVTLVLRLLFLRLLSLSILIITFLFFSGTLLNLLFGTTFPVMDAHEGRTQTTQGWSPSLFSLVLLFTNLLSQWSAFVILFVQVYGWERLAHPQRRRKRRFLCLMWRELTAESAENSML